jgi:hypothetical protein
MCARSFMLSEVCAQPHIFDTIGCTPGTKHTPTFSVYSYMLTMHAVQCAYVLTAEYPPREEGIMSRDWLYKNTCPSHD